MRTAFVEELTKIAREDKRVMLLTGDLGYSVFEPFIAEFPDQYLNVGVAEQNLIGVAAGLAMTGKKVFVYSISTFATMRPFEQIRNDVCYQNLPVFIIGGGSTFSYSTFGCTHFPLEDIGIMRLLPHMAVICPCDPIEVRMLIRSVYERGGPAYIRIAKRGEPEVHGKEDQIILGASARLREGRDATIFVAGRQMPFVMSAAKKLSALGIECRVVSMHTIKPLDKDAIHCAAKETRAILTVEEHFVTGGLGTAVAEVLIKQSYAIPFHTIGVPDEFPSGVGSQEYFLERYAITEDGILDSVKRLLGNF